MTRTRRHHTEYMTSSLALLCELKVKAVNLNAAKTTGGCTVRLLPVCVKRPRPTATNKMFQRPGGTPRWTPVKHLYFHSEAVKLMHILLFFGHCRTCRRYTRFKSDTCIDLLTSSRNSSTRLKEGDEGESHGQI